MVKLNRHLLSVLIIAEANMVPLQVQAQSNMPKTTERGTSSKKPKLVEKFNTKKFKITADKKQKEAIEQALQDIYSTKSGKELLKRMPKGMTIEVKEMNVRGIHINSINVIQLAPRLFSDPFQLSVTLLHEMHHCSQDCEHRINRKQKGDGIEGYVDFVTRKLCELEPKVFEAIYTVEREYTPGRSKRTRDIDLVWARHRWRRFGARNMPRRIRRRLRGGGFSLGG